MITLDKTLINGLVLARPRVICHSDRVEIPQSTTMPLQLGRFSLTIVLIRVYPPQTHLDQAVNKCGRFGAAGRVDAEGAEN